jgi:hypothetical protein
MISVSSSFQRASSASGSSKIVIRSSFGAKTSKAKSPPGARCRRTALRHASWSSTARASWKERKAEKMRPNRADPKSKSRIEPNTRRRFSGGPFARSSPSIASEESRPVHAIPSPAIGRRARPVPQPSSRTGPPTSLAVRSLPRREPPPSLRSGDYSRRELLGDGGSTSSQGSSVSVFDRGTGNLPRRQGLRSRRAKSPRGEEARAAGAERQRGIRRAVEGRSRPSRSPVGRRPRSHANAERRRIARDGDPV